MLSNFPAGKENIDDIDTEMCPECGKRDEQCECE
jgi:hypothetical protein